MFDRGGSIGKDIPTLGFFFFFFLRRVLLHLENPCSVRHTDTRADSVAHKDKRPEPCVLPFWLPRSFRQIGILYSGLEFS